MVTCASNELGISDHDQMLVQIEEFSRRQLAAVSPLLTAQQLKVYRQIQRERLAQQRSYLENGFLKADGQGALRGSKVRLGIAMTWNPVGQSVRQQGVFVAHVQSGSVAIELRQ